MLLTASRMKPTGSIRLLAVEGNDNRECLCQESRDLVCINLGTQQLRYDFHVVHSGNDSARPGFEDDICSLLSIGYGQDSRRIEDNVIHAWPLHAVR